MPSFGISDHAIVNATVAAYTAPTRAYPNQLEPSWVDIENMQIKQAFSMEPVYRPNRYLIALALIFLDGSDVQVNGHRFFPSVLTAKRYVMPIHLDQPCVTGRLRPFATWAGRVPIPYGFGIWSHGLTDTYHFYLNAVIEDEI